MSIDIDHKGRLFGGIEGNTVGGLWSNATQLHELVHEYGFQRKSMTNHCGPAANDPGFRNDWGVDINRNFSVGSLFDGYAGASSDCTHPNYAGPAELSEPESRNEVWLTQTFANIRFYLNVHSYGGYFLWPPDSYTLPERETLPRLPQAETDFSWAAASTFLSRVREHRGTAIWPSRTGDADVWNFYPGGGSGTAGDEHWYNRGIYSFVVEVSAPKPFRDEEGTLLGWVGLS